LPFKGGVDIQNGYLAIKSNQTTAAEFQAIEVHLNIDENALPITLTASGKTSSGPTVGNFNITGQIASGKTNSELSKWITGKLGLPKSTPLNYTLDVNLRNFPLTGTLNAAIGPTLTLQTELHAGDAEDTLSLSAHSQQLNANINAKAPASSLLIASGSTANWQITPPFWQIFGTNLRLLQPVQGNFRAESIEIPIGMWNQATGQVTATFTDGVITPSAKDAPVTISHTTIQLSTQNLQQALDIAISSALNNGLLTANFTYPQPLEGAPTLYALLTKLKAKATNFPTALFGLSDYLGEALNFAIESDNNILDISASSNLLNARMLEFKITPQALQLRRPADIRYTLKSMYLTSETPISISLSELYLPSLWQQMRFQGQLSASQATLKPLGSYGQIQLIDSNLSINAKTLHDASFTFLSRMGFIGQTGLFKELLGPALRLSGQGKADLTERSIPTLKLTATGKTSELQIDAALDDQTLILKKPIKLQTILTKKAFNLLKPEALSNLSLVQDAPISFALDPFKLKLPEFTWQSALTANFKAPTLQLKSNQPFTITNLDTSISLSTETTAIETRGHIQDGAFDLSLNLNNPDSTIQKADIAFTSFSTAVLDSLLAPEQSLSNTLGSTFDLNLDIDPKRYQIHLTSPNLSIAGAFKIDTHNYINSTNTPLTITYLLTPEAYRNYQKTAQFTLASPAKIQLNIQQLKAPLKSKPTLKTPIPSINWDLSQILINLKARSEELTFTQNKIQASLHNLDLHLKKTTLSDPVQFNLDAGVSTQKNAKAKQQSGSIQLAGSLTDYYDQNGHFSTQNLSTDLSGQIKQMPTLLLDALAPDSAALFGDYLNATLAAQIHNMNGTLTCAVTSPHTTFKLDSY
ncbi:MAG TPA: hypothetical protein PLO43_03315, partial [Chlamydiales bacterium]|nr:hypothetical protein [Chlamydiales bacterium]